MSQSPQPTSTIPLIFGPSSRPTSTPSITPTSQPSFTPSISPSVSKTPSELPTFSPSFSTLPTFSPSLSPSVSEQPSNIPSFSPSISSRPSSNPTFINFLIQPKRPTIGGPVYVRSLAPTPTNMSGDMDNWVTPTIVVVVVVLFVALALFIAVRKDLFLKSDNLVSKSEFEHQSAKDDGQIKNILEINDEHKQIDWDRDDTNVYYCTLQGNTSTNRVTLEVEGGLQRNINGADYKNTNDKLYQASFTTNILTSNRHFSATTCPNRMMMNASSGYDESIERVRSVTTMGRSEKLTKVDVYMISASDNELINVDSYDNEFSDRRTSNNMNEGYEMISIPDGVSKDIDMDTDEYHRDTQQHPITDNACEPQSVLPDLFRDKQHKSLKVSLFKRIHYMVIFPMKLYAYHNRRSDVDHGYSICS